MEKESDYWRHVFNAPLKGFILVFFCLYNYFYFSDMQLIYFDAVCFVHSFEMLCKRCTLHITTGDRKEPAGSVHHGGAGSLEFISRRST